MGQHKLEHSIIEIFNFWDYLEINDYGLTYTDPASTEM